MLTYSMAGQSAGPTFNGEMLRSLRESRNLSIPELAREMGISHTYVQNLEKGLVRMPSDPYLEKIAAFFQVPAMQLLTMPGADDQLTTVYEPVDPDLQGVQVNLRKLKALSPDDIKVVERVVASMLKEAQELDQERRRAKSKQSRSEHAGQGNS